tara:strand:+ start:5218 stop:7917 length:2700 start_codon:yes stop_codon:yes gene_type:complete
MAKGFTDYISDAVAKDQVLESGRATEADRTFQGRAIANLGKTIIEGGSELTTEVYENNLFQELSNAKTSAFKELQAYHKKGTTAVKQGRTSVSLFNASLLNKVNEIEARYPGFSEETEKAKRLMGIKPVEDLVKEQQRIQVRNETLLFQSAKENGNLVFASDGSIDVPETLNLQIKYDNNAREMAELQIKAKRDGILEPEKHSKGFLEGFDTLITHSNLQFGKATAQIQSMVNELIQSGSGQNAERVLVGITTYLDQWQLSRINSVMSNGYPQGTKDYEFLVKDIQTQTGLLRQIITGSKDSKGIVDRIKSLDAYRKAKSQEQFRNMLPALARMMDVFDPQAATSILLKATQIDDLTKIDPSVPDTLRSFINGANNTTTLTNPQLPTNNSEAVKNSAKFALGVISDTLKSNRPGELSSNTLYKTFVSPMRAHLNGLLKPQEYDAFREQFANPLMQAQIESNPNPKHRREMGMFGYQMFNGAVEKHLQQIQQMGSFAGLEINDQGKLVIVEDQGMKEAIERRIGSFGIVDEANATLDKYVNVMAYYSMYNDDVVSEDRRFDPERQLAVRSLLQEMFALKYPKRDTQVPEKFNPLSKLVPPNFQWKDAVTSVLGYIDNVAGRIADVQKRKDPFVEIPEAARAFIKNFYSPSPEDSEPFGQQTEMVNTPEPSPKDGAALLPDELKEPAGPIGFEIPSEGDAGGAGPGRPRSLRPEDQGRSYDYTAESETVIDAAGNRLDVSNTNTLKEGVKVISQVVEAVETGGQADPKTATNPTSSATGYYQIISGTRQSAAKRLIDRIDSGKVPDWINQAAQNMTKKEHQEFMGSLSKNQQETLFLTNLFESPGSDVILKRIVDSDFQDEDAIADLYMKIHHTEPSAKLKRRFIKSLNEVKGLLMEEEMK